MNSVIRTAAVALGAAALVVCGVGISAASGALAGGHGKPVPAGRQPAVAPGIAADEGVFTSITPCRIVNTRAKGGKVSTARSFYVGGTLHFLDQGGTSGGCGIPAGATAVSANIVATGGTKSGYVKAYPAGASAPNASVINFDTGTIANGLALAIQPGTAQALTVLASSPVDILIDITGYYAPQITVFVNASGSIGTGTPRVLGVTHTAGSGYYLIAVDRNVFSCSATATTQTAGNYVGAVTAGGDDVEVDTWQLSSTATVVPHDATFNLTVTC